jgi:hypothetical protein
MKGKDGKELGIRGLVNHWLEDNDHMTRTDSHSTHMLAVAADQLSQALPNDRP